MPLTASCNYKRNKKLKEIIGKPASQIPASINPESTKTTAKHEVFNSYNKNDRMVLLKAFVTENQTDWIPCIRMCLKDNDWEIRENAAIALGNMGDTASIPFLIDALNDSNDTVKIKVMKALGKLKASSSSPRLLSFINSNNKDIQTNAIYTLSKIGYKPENDNELENIFKVLKDDDYRVRLIVANILGNTSNKKSVIPLTEAINDNSEIVKNAIVDALGKLGDTRAVPYIISSLDDKTDTTMAIELRALSKIGDKQAIQYLSNRLKKENTINKMLFISSLTNYHDSNVAEVLLDTMKNNQDSIRAYSILALVSIADTAAIKPIINIYFSDNSVDVRNAAIYVLNELKAFQLDSGLKRDMKIDDKDILKATKYIKNIYLGRIREMLLGKPKSNIIEPIFNKYIQNILRTILYVLIGVLFVLNIIFDTTCSQAQRNKYRMVIPTVIIIYLGIALYSIYSIKYHISINLLNIHFATFAVFIPNIAAQIILQKRSNPIAKTKRNICILVTAAGSLIILIMYKINTIHMMINNMDTIIYGMRHNYNLAVIVLSGILFMIASFIYIFIIITRRAVFNKDGIIYAEQQWAWSDFQSFSWNIHRTNNSIVELVLYTNISWLIDKIKLKIHIDDWHKIEELLKNIEDIKKSQE